MKTKLKKLPLGIQTFSTIRDENYVYVDKTNIAFELIEEYKYVFLSRPRRFGKSLFLDTLQEIFEGNKRLFEGLGIYDKWDWETKYPVIKISFSGELRSKVQLNERIRSVLKNNQERLEIFCEENQNISICLDELIRKTHKKNNQKVVVLIDEYDKAILDNLDQMEVAKENRETLKGFYSVLKDSDPYLKFVFLTGVSKFSKSSIFSGLNMLSDISLNWRFGDICGYTHADVQREFESYLEGVDVEKLTLWYNGYNFLGNSMYNPFDILQFLKNDKIFDNYWFATGTPTFLIKLIDKNNYFLPKLSNLKIGKQLLDSFDIDDIDLEVILYQSGYLTIESVDIDEEFDIIEYNLKIPNKEVKQSLNRFIINHLYGDKNPTQKNILIALKNQDIGLFERSLRGIFASIPNNNYTKNKIHNYEGFYASVVFVYLQSLGLDIIGEDVTNQGRIDLTIKTAHAFYILEFKLKGRNNALEQIKSKNYHEKYLNANNPIYLIGIEFDKEDRNLSLVEWEKVV